MYYSHKKTTGRIYIRQKVDLEDGMKKQTYLKGSLILMASAVAAKVLGAAFRIPLTNMLGGVGMGYFGCAYSIFMPVYALIVTGISSAVARLTASRAALGLYGSVKQIRSTALLIFTAAGVPASLLMAAIAKPYSIYSAGSPNAAAGIMMIAPAVVFGCITAVERGYYEGLSNMYPTALSQAAEGLVKAAAGLWLCGYVTSHESEMLRLFPWAGDIRALASAAGILGVTLSTAAAALYFGIMRMFSAPLPEGDLTFESRRTIAKELIRAALPIGIAALVTDLSALIDMWSMIGVLSRSGAYEGMFTGAASGESAQFVYGSFSGIALTVFNLVPSVTNMLGKGALTNTAAARELGSHDALKNSSMQALLAAAVISVPAAVGLGLFAPEVLGLLFPRQSEEVALCILPMRLLMPGMLCLCLSFPVFSMLQGVGRSDAPLKIMLAGTAAKLAGNLALLPVIGVEGAAVSTSLSYVLILSLALRTYFRESGIKLDAKPFASIIYAGAMCAGTSFLVGKTAERSGSLAVLVFAGTAGGAAYIAVLRATKMRCCEKQR